MTMTLEGKGQFRKVPYVKGGKTYFRNEIYIPSNVAGDSNFPFRDRENINVKIIGEKIVLEKIEE